MAQNNTGGSAEFFSKDGIFSLKPLSWFRPNARITHVVVSNDFVFAATAANTLLIVNANDKSTLIEIEISHLSDDRVHNLFVDPRGCHIVISMQSGTNFYTIRGSKKVKQLTKARNHLFDSLAWNESNESETTTQEILIGTNEGIIFEAVLSNGEDRFRSSAVESLWKEMIRLDHSVNGLAVVRYPPGSTHVIVGESQLCVVLATTPGRLYQFVGRIQTPDSATTRIYMTAQAAASALREGYLPGLYGPIFQAYAQNLSASKCIEFPVSYGYSDLKIFKKKGDEVASQFAWMTASGLYCGRLEFTRLIDPELIAAVSATEENRAPCRISLTSNAKLIPYSTLTGEHVSLPLGISLAEFHVIVAYVDRLKAINLLDDAGVFSQLTSEALGGGPTGAIVCDAATGKIWLQGAKGVAQLVVENESVRIWRIHMERGEFDLARQFCACPEQLDKVNCREAEYCFSRGEYIQSAELFAETSTPFEEVALRFSQTSVLAMRTSRPVTAGVALDEDYIGADDEEEEEDEGGATTAGSGDDGASAKLLPVGINLQLMTPSTPLKAFLRAKLARLDSSVDSGAPGQAAIVALWLMELLLGEIGLLEDRCSKPNAPAVHQEELDEVRREFRKLIKSRPIEKLLPDCNDVIYQLLSSHGNHKDYVFFAKTISDYNRLVDHYMSRGAYTEALFILTAHPSCSAQLYEYSAQLSSFEPKMLVDAWIRAGQRLSPEKLLPTVLLLPSVEAIRYLEFVVDQLNCQEQAVHHQLILLYASDKEADEAKLLGYFKRFNNPELSEVFSSVRLGNFDMGDIKRENGTSSKIDSAFSVMEPVLPYDSGFALRTCTEHGCLRSTVLLLKSLGLYEQAVEEALSKNNVELAKEIVNSDALGLDTQRALWLRIARNVITDQSNLQEATALLRESSLLRLEDVFPLFPDFVTIDQFRETICESLDAYNSQIEQLKLEMRATVESTNEICSQLNNLKLHFEVIPENARCSHCLHALALRTFYIFSCGHFFHTDCLMNLVRPHLDPKDAAKLADLYSCTETDSSAVSNFRAQFDELVATDCVFCGRIAIANVDKLYFPDEKSYEAEMRFWN